MKRFQTALFILAGLGLAVIAMLVIALLIGTDDRTDEPSGPLPVRAR